jgi:hypothetical protein
MAAAKLALETIMYDRCMKNAPHDVVWAKDCSGPYNEHVYFPFGEVAVLEWVHRGSIAYPEIKVFIHGAWEDYYPLSGTLWRIIEKDVVKDEIYVLEALKEGYPVSVRGKYASMVAAKFALEAEIHDRCMRNASYDVVWAKDCSGPYNEHVYFPFSEVAVLEWTHRGNTAYSEIKAFIHGAWEDHYPLGGTLWRITREE